MSFVQDFFRSGISRDEYLNNTLQCVGDTNQTLGPMAQMNGQGTIYTYIYIYIHTQYIIDTFIVCIPCQF